MSKWYVSAEAAGKQEPPSAWGTVTEDYATRAAWGQTKAYFWISSGRYSFLK
jgi:hypothetical protein